MFHFNRGRFIKFFLYNIHSERNKTEPLDETGDLCSYSADRFFLISVETDTQLREKEQNTDES